MDCNTNAKCLNQCGTSAGCRIQTSKDGNILTNNDQSDDIVEQILSTLGTIKDKRDEVTRVEDQDNMATGMPEGGCTRCT